MKFALSTRKHNPAEIYPIAMEVGFDGVEVVMPSRINSANTEWVLSGVKNILAIHAPIDEYDHNRFKSALIDAISFALPRQVPIVNIHPPSAHDEFGGKGNVAEGIMLIKELSERHPTVRICYEVLGFPNKPHHQRQKAYGNPDEWLREVRSSNLCATVDTTHIASYGYSPAEYIVKTGRHLAHVHLSDYGEGKEHLFPQEGEIPWEHVFEALRGVKNSSKLCLSFEPSGRFDVRKKEEKKRLKKSLEFVRKGLGL